VRKISFSESCTVGISMLLSFLALVFWLALLDTNDRVKNGGQFILGEATYKCIKTNELKE